MSEVDGGGKRLNEGKVPLDMVPTSMLYAVARVMEYGAQKYEKDNWRRGMKWSVPYACAMRHLLKWFEGEEADEESGESHLYHVLCNIAMLIEYSGTCPELDDRYKGKLRGYGSFTKKTSLQNEDSKVDLGEDSIGESLTNINDLCLDDNNQRR
jgi:hypothetical protein